VPDDVFCEHDFRHMAAGRRLPVAWALVGKRGLLRAAGLVIWAFAGIPAAVDIARDTTCATAGEVARVSVWIGAFAVFGLAFFRATARELHADRRLVRLIAVQSLAALAMNVVLCTGFEAALLAVVAVELGLTLAPRLALPWLVAQTVVLLGLAAHHMGPHRTLYWSLVVIGAEAFAFTVAAIAGRESVARRALEAANAELRATRESLARASRDGERLRIAREMHDLLGHDMVALHLELETAGHLAEGRAREPVERAQRIGKTLLADLRRAVSQLRSDDHPVDVAAVVRGLLDGVKGPRVHLDAPSVLELHDGERANTLVRCVQEIATNTIKHAAAANLWISLEHVDGRVTLRARDDGRGAPSFAPGHGLAGMRERMSALGGELALETGAGDGFRVCATLPIEGRVRA
jgi:signal transduction histidine kinase